MKLDVSHAKFKAIEFFDRCETIFVDIFPLQTLHQTFLCAVGMRKWSSFWEKIFQTKTENILSQNETTFSFLLISPEKVLIGLSLVFVCMVCLLVLCV